jgi:DNA-directed RNA polymerase specialized sigma24 family protein
MNNHSFIKDQAVPQEAFHTTRWSVVLRAAQGDGENALAQLCRDYWYPLYAFVRRRGFSEHDAQDFTQGFFAHVLDGTLLNRASEEKGRFRSYVLRALQHFIANEQRRIGTQKRGGGVIFIPIDPVEGEQRFASEPVEMMTPEIQFERNWAFSLLECVLGRLRQEYLRAGRPGLFDTLQPYLAGEARGAGYEALGRELVMSTSAVAVAIHRMRRRYGELLREEIAHTVSSPREVDEELAYLRVVVARA